MRAVSVPERMDLGPGPWVLLAGVAVVGAQALLLAPVLPDVARTLDTGPAAIGRALGAYGAATAVAAFTVGRALDRLPRRATLRAAAALMASGLLVCAAAPNAVVLAAGQAVAGLAAGVTLPATYASAGEIAPVGAETRVMGRVLLGWSVAMVAGVPAAAALGDLIGWRGVFVVLAALAAAMVGLYRVLPAGIPSREGSRAGVPAGAEAARRATMRAAPRVRYRDALARPGVPALLLVCLAYMVAFYGTYAFVGDRVRTVHGAGAATAGLIAMAYGLGFGAAGTVDHRIDRHGPARLLAPAVVVLAGCYALLPAATAHLPVLLALALVWGFVNHAGLSMLVSLLAVAGGDARGAVMALYSTVTYVAASLAGAGLGAVYESAGFAWVAGVSAAGLLLAAVPAAGLRRTASRAASRA